MESHLQCTSWFQKNEFSLDTSCKECNKCTFCSILCVIMNHILAPDSLLTFHSCSWAQSMVAGNRSSCAGIVSWRKRVWFLLFICVFCSKSVRPLGWLRTSELLFFTSDSWWRRTADLTTQLNIFGFTHSWFQTNSLHLCIHMVPHKRELNPPPFIDIIYYLVTHTNNWWTDMLVCAHTCRLLFSPLSTNTLLNCRSDYNSSHTRVTN